MEFIFVIVAAVLMGFSAYHLGRKHMSAKQVADREELYRWRVGHSEAERWLAEFPDVAVALEHLKAEAYGTAGMHISRTREVMRTRRDSAPSRDRRSAARVCDVQKPVGPANEFFRSTEVRDISGGIGGA